MMDGAPTNLAQFRRRHGSLMRETLKPDGIAALTGEIEAFVADLAAFGAKLSGEDDRVSAQNILDYWASSLAGAGEVRLSRQAVRLQPFESAAAAHADTATALPKDNPFGNIAAISREDGTRLPGREDAIRAVLELLENSALVFVTGSAGSGRSALVSAGVLWQIENSDRPAAVFRIGTPAPDPLAALAVCVSGATASEIATSPQKFRARFDAARGDRRGVLAIDNVEELFTRCDDQQARNAFAAAVVALCVPDKDGKRNEAILILRDEWAAQILALKAFEPFASKARFTPPPPTAAELQRTIERPASAAGVTFEPGIVEDLARELQGDIGALPLLQFMLLRLWPLNVGGRITWDVYRKLGRPYDALTSVAEATYAGLGPSDQTTARDMFLALTRPSLDGAGAARSHRESRKALTERGASKIVDAFEAAGLLRASSSVGADDAIELTHDGLMYRWDRLIGWLVDERRSSERRTTLVASARLWQSSGRRPGYLISDKASLDEARQYASTAPELSDLVAASEAFVRRRMLIQWAGIGILIVLSIVSVVTASTAIMQYRRAAAEAKRANDEAFLARNAERAATSARQTAESVAVALQAQIDKLAQRSRVAEAKLVPTSASPTPASAAQNGSALAAANIVPDSVVSAYGAQRSASGRISGYLWVGSDGKPNIEGDTVPSAIKQGERLTLKKNIVLREGKPSSDYAQAPSLGVLRAGSVVTATGAPIAYNRSLGVQYWLPVQADPPPLSIAFQYANAGTGKPDAVADTLKKLGYQVPGIEHTALSTGLNEVRWFNQLDKPAADKLAEQLTRTLKTQGEAPTVKSVDYSNTGYKVQPGNVELWLDLPPK